MDAGRVGSEGGPLPGPVLDQPLLQSLVADFGADEVEGLFDLFARDAVERAGVLRAAIDRRDIEQAARAAHALRSSAGTAGALAYATACTRIEEHARRGDFAAARAAADSLGGELASATAALAVSLGRGAGGFQQNG